ncbi:uncharacterized protein simc1 [Nematolebias whitei]|uniref:uncharacterized protein simc1 n=1 Tax=Nematolebias whitei TaxID=451745 RepID=UPI001899BEE8|nr:uncharacterized protein simc1 [Nematolebias whitei]
MDVICLSSDESNDDDVEIVSSSGFTKSEPLPLSEFRVDVDAVNVNIPRQCIDLKDPRWTVPELKLHKKLDFPYPPVIDLTECVEKENELQTEDKVPNDLHLKKGNTHLNEIPNDQDFILMKSSPKDSKSPQQDCGTQRSGKRHLNSPTQAQEENTAANLRQDTPAVKLTQLPFLKTHVSDLNTSWCSEQCDSDISQMLMCFRQQNSNSEVPKCTSILKTTSSNMEPSLPEALNSPTRHQINDKLSKESTQGARSEQFQHPAECSTIKEVHSGANLNKGNTWENKLLTSSLNSSNHILSPTFISSPQAKVPKQALDSDLEQMDLDQPEPGQRCSSDHSSSHSCKSPSSPSHMSHGNQSPISEPTGEYTPEWYLETETYNDDLRSESPASLPWHGESDGEDMREDSRFVTDFRAVGKGVRQYVCPVALRKAMTGPPRVLIDEDYDISGTPEVLCRQSLSLVYSTIDENYSEGTLQLLSDLLQPGYYPPKDIISHLLRGILLDPQSPHHLSVQAFNLLMWTQRHHRINKSTVPWDWELVTSVMSNQDCTKQRRCEVVRMFLEYVVQTLEDDFKAKCSSSVHHSIAKATLSCDRQFPRVRDVIKWLFCAIKKSTELGLHKEMIKERDEQLKMVSLFQRMLSLALEVDRCPALNSAKLSQELFHMVLSHVPPRAHR